MKAQLYPKKEYGNDATGEFGTDRVTDDEDAPVDEVKACVSRDSLELMPYLKGRMRKLFGVSHSYHHSSTGNTWPEEIITDSYCNPKIEGTIYKHFAKKWRSAYRVKGGKYMTKVEDRRAAAQAVLDTIGPLIMESLETRSFHLNSYGSMDAHLNNRLRDAYLLPGYKERKQEAMKKSAKVLSDYKEVLNQAEKILTNAQLGMCDDPIGQMNELRDMYK